MSCTKVDRKRFEGPSQNYMSTVEQPYYLEKSIKINGHPFLWYYSEK